MENWKPIANTFGMIEVSDCGHIRSLLSGLPRVLKEQTDNKGYKRVTVTVKRNKMHFKVHREVAKAFIDNPDNLPQVNHKDGNKTNNNVENLEWCTNRDNCVHALQLGLYSHQTKSADSLSVNELNYVSHKRGAYGNPKIWNNPNPKKPIVAREVGTDNVKYFDSVGEAERAFNSRHICAVLKGKRQKVKGWTFEYAKGVVV